MDDEWIPHQEEADDGPIDMVVVVKVDACDQIGDDVSSGKKGVENPKKEYFDHCDRLT